MPFPFVTRATYLKMVHAANEYAQALAHERRTAADWSRRYDDLFARYDRLRRDGYVVPEELPIGPIVVRSVADADEDAAKAQILVEIDD